MNFEESVRRLAPPPRSVARGRGAWHLPPRLAAVLPPAGDLEGSPAFAELARRLAARGVVLAREGRPELRFTLDPRLAREAYRLEISPEGAQLAAGSRAGLVHGLRTLTQWARLHGREGAPLALDGVLIEDAPSFAERGVMIDVARDKRPTLETLFALVERLARLKINRLQLYMEADFAYSFGADATRGRSPYTAAELCALDDFCAAHDVELVPNQQSFGHMHHWLRHATWRGLAEVPAGVEHPFSRVKEPFSLCPGDPGSLVLLGRMFDELLPCFRSREFNVGLDETFDLGLGRSREACEARGKQALYVEFLREVHALARERGKRVQFWGDIVLESPELCAELPDDAICLDWGYEADHPFEAELAALAASRHAFHVCPGTSSWNSFVGRTPNALANLRAAARSGVAHGARGMLTTDWGDRGHLQPWPISAPGFALGATLAWNADGFAESDRERLAGWLDDWWFEDRARVLGRAVLELGRLQEVTGDACKNGAAAFFLVIFGQRGLDDERLAGLTVEGLERAAEHLDGVLAPLARIDSARADGALIARELELARDLAALGVDLGRARLAAGGVRSAELAAGERAALAERLAGLAAVHRELWPRRHRPGGLEASARWLEELLPELESVR